MEYLILEGLGGLNVRERGLKVFGLEPAIQAWTRGCPSARNAQGVGPRGQGVGRPEGVCYSGLALQLM